MAWYTRQPDGSLKELPATNFKTMSKASRRAYDKGQADTEALFDKACLVFHKKKKEKHGQSK